MNTKALGGLPTALDRRGSDLLAARSYLMNNTTISTFGLMDMFGTHERVVAAVYTYLTVLDTDYASADAARFRAVIASYQAVDLRAAARADAAVPGAPAPLVSATPISTAEAAYGPEIFTDSYDPTVALITPSSHIADTPYQPSWSDLLSPASVGRDAVWELTSLLHRAGLLDRPVDPFAEIVRPFVGDWPGLLRSADVFDQLADALRTCADCVAKSSLTIPEVWTGNVAAIGQESLEDFAAAMRDGAKRCDGLAGTYRTVAKGVQDNATLLETLITDLVDLAADAVLNVVTIGLFSVFAGGDEVRDFMSTLYAVVKLVNTTIDLIGSAKSASDDAANRLGILASPGQLPTVSAPTVQVPIPALPPSARLPGKPTPIPWRIWDAPDA